MNENYISMQQPANIDTSWFIDIGPFFDRFGAAKYSVLTSTDATVKALVTDITSRHWVDLKRADVAQGVDAIIGLISGIDPSGTLKNQVLGSPATFLEQLVLKKLYF